MSLWAYKPNDDYIGGRFTAVSYLGHTYTIYRPADSQPYVLLSDNPKLDPATQAEVLALSMTLDAANGLLTAPLRGSRHLHRSAALVTCTAPPLRHLHRSAASRRSR